MNPKQWEAINEIFHSAIDLDSDRRASFLEQACGDDITLRNEIESLINASAAAGDFIASPPSAISLPSVASPEHLDPGEEIGHYRIEKIIGTGGMGEVYLAADTKLNRPVAIKRLPLSISGDPSFLKRFRTEAQAAAIVNHPNVATVFSVEESDDESFITMEYVEGKTLGSITPRGGMDLQTFLSLFIDISDALQHAHEKGIIHRDIKPGNIMVTSGGTPKILDFGLAQISSDNRPLEESGGITIEGQVIGTPAYMSPEQARGKEVDHRTDIFSLGVVMYETLTGSRPFTGENNVEVVSNLLKTDPPLVSETRPDVPPLIARLIARCLAKRRADRLQSMQEICTILREAQALLDAGVSTGSFGRRLYRETISTGPKWRVAAGLSGLVLAFLGWYIFSAPSRKPPISFEKMSMRKLSQSNNVGYSVIAPDGKSIAYATFDEEGGTRTLWIRRVEDRNALQIVPPQKASYWGGIAISEDGGQVFYLTANRSSIYGTLYRVSSLGGPSRELIDEANDVGGISRDGQRMLFVRYGEPSRIISASAIDGSDERVIQFGPPEAPQTNFRDPQFSADEKSIHYIRYERIEGIEYWSLATLPLDGGPEKQILRQKERMGEIAVLRDGSGLLITSYDPQSNLQQLYHVELPAGEKTRITNDLGFYFGVSVDREGRNIVSSQRNDESRVWVGDASDLTSLKPVGKEPNVFRNVDWTPNGRIVYDAFENNRPHIYIANADGTNVQQLTSGAFSDSEPKVSGDGRYIVFSSDRSGFNQVWRMEVDGSDQIPLATVSGVTQEPRFAADGQTVVFNWLRERDRALAKVPVEGGSVEEMSDLKEIPLFNAYYWAMSPDGKYVAYLVRDEAERVSKVAVRTADLSESTTTILNIWPSLIFKWMPDSRSILYRERQVAYQPESEAFKIDIETKEPKSLMSVAPDVLLDMTYSRDGKQVAIIRGRGTSNAVLMTATPDKEIGLR